MWCQGHRWPASELRAFQRAGGCVPLPLLVFGFGIRIQAHRDGGSASEVRRDFQAGHGSLPRPSFLALGYPVADTSELATSMNARLSFTSLLYGLRVDFSPHFFSCNRPLHRHFFYCCWQMTLLFCSRLVW